MGSNIEGHHIQSATGGGDYKVSKRCAYKALIRCAYKVLRSSIRRWKWCAYKVLHPKKSENKVLHPKMGGIIVTPLYYNYILSGQEDRLSKFRLKSINEESGLERCFMRIRIEKWG